MAASEAATLMILGTPLVSEKERLRAMNGAEKYQVKTDEVVDEQGHKRFHGAFEGGFSAGYFNTVASEQGWTPSQYVRGQRSKRVEDYMDDEDDALMGATLRAREGFSDPLGLVDQRKQVDAWGESKLMPGPVPSELLAARTLASKGRALLAAMGPWPQSRQLQDKGSGGLKDCARRGLGSRRLHEQEQSDAAALAWKRRRKLQGADNDEEEEEQERESANPLRLAFEAVEVESSSDEDRASEGFAQRILLKDGIGGQDKPQTWLDGAALCAGFVLARKHDPNDLLKAKRDVSTPVPANANPFHDPGTSRPMTRPLSHEAVADARRKQEEARAQVLKDFKESLSSRFSAPGQTPAVAKPLVPDVSADPTVFLRSKATWEPVGLLRTRFGVVGALAHSNANKPFAAGVSAAAAAAAAGATISSMSQQGAAAAPLTVWSQLSERKAVLGSASVALYESSDDDQSEVSEGDAAHKKNKAEGEHSSSSENDDGDSAAAAERRHERKRRKKEKKEKKKKRKKEKKKRKSEGLKV